MKRIDDDESEKEDAEADEGEERDAIANELFEGSDHVRRSFIFCTKFNNLNIRFAFAILVSLSCGVLLS